MVESAIKLYGTDQPNPETLALRAGPLTATFDNGQLRWITLGGVEVIRAIAFLIRDRNWSTAVPVLKNVVADTADGGFHLRFEAHCETIDGKLTWHGDLVGRPDGSLSYEGWATPEADFLTGRTGFVILHPLEGVVGRPITIEHVDGSVEQTVAPELIDPAQSFLNVRAMTTEPLPGVKATVRMEGDTWETEDHRNWTDASFKTYVRPLSLPWPYALKAGEEVRQRVTLSFAGAVPKQPGAAPGPVTVRLGGAAGRMPEIGAGVLPQYAAAAAEAAPLVRQAGLQFLNCRIDLDSETVDADLAHYRTLQQQTGAAIVLEVIFPDREGPAVELKRAADAVKRAGLEPAAVVVTPAPDLKSYPPGTPFPEVTPFEEIFAAARAAFPGIRLGGGMMSFFPELNRKRPPADRLDFVVHGSGATIHAADDRSVMETLEALPHIFRSTRAFAGADKPYRVGPSNMGMPFNPYGASTTPNPNNERVTMTSAEPRQRGLFGAAWAAGFIMQAANNGLEAVSFSGPVGEAGIIYKRLPISQPWFDTLKGDAVYPMYHVVAGLAAAAGKPVTATASSDPGRVLAVAYGNGGTTLWLAHLRDGEEEVRIEGAPAGEAELMLLDAASFETATTDPGFSGRGAKVAGDRIRLGPFAIARLRYGS